MRLLFLKLVVPMIFVMHAVLLLSTLFTLWPEMVVYPYLFNGGFKLYQDLINPYPPYLTMALGLFTKFFGYDPINFKLLTIVVVILTDLIIFRLSLKIFKNLKIAVVNTTFFVFVSVPFGINGLWFDLFQTPLIILAVYFLLFSKHKRNILISSIFISAAILIKQQALWLVPLFLALSLKKPFNSKKNIKVTKDFFLPLLVSFVLTLLLVTTISDLDGFFTWAIILPLFRSSSLPGYVLLPSLRQLIIATSLFLFFTPFLINISAKQRTIIYLAFYLLIFAYPRFDYFHLIPSLAVLSLVAGKVVTSIKLKPLSIAPLILLAPLLAYQVRFYANNLKPQIRFFENDIIDVSQKIKSLSSPSDKFYVQNGPDQILTLSGRLPPKPWADEFPWYLENNDLQQKIVEKLNDQKPKYAIVKPYSQGQEFALGSYRPKQIAEYLGQNYRFVQLLDDELYLKQINEK